MRFLGTTYSIYTSCMIFILTMGNTFYSRSAIAFDPEQGCSNLGFSLKVKPVVSATPDNKIEVAGVPLNSVIAYLEPEDVTGICDTGFSTNPSPGDIPPGLGFVAYRATNCNGGLSYDNGRNISMFCLNSMNALLEYDGDFGSSPVRPVAENRKTNHITLQKKTPGVTVVDLTSLTNNFSDIYSTWGSYDWNIKKETFTLRTFPSTLTLIYTPTCSAEVNDVEFGTLSPLQIKDNSVAAQKANINISCNDILPKYSVSFSSPNGVMPDKTTIQSDNPTIGYRLFWGDKGSMGTIKLEEVHEKNTNSQNVTIPVDITPVSLTSGNITPGKANSAIIINLKFN
ncbi:fimbrial protein [Salmonella enterica subsp. enterica serovar Typhimurium]|nr:fimbrial protein [Salmonella enterica subsp. enterica serovar Typhimurium]